jgi:hypothetical protein
MLLAVSHSSASCISYVSCNLAVTIYDMTVVVVIQGFLIKIPGQIRSYTCVAHTGNLRRPSEAM